MTLNTHLNTNRYVLQRPPEWETVNKAGADALFRNPSDKGTTVGVTVAPTRLASLPQFGSVQEVGDRLLAAEKAKVVAACPQLIRPVCATLGVRACRRAH